MSNIFTQNGEVLTPRQVVEMKELSCTLLVRVFGFVIAAVEQGKGANKNLVQSICRKDFWYPYSTFTFETSQLNDYLSNCLNCKITAH